MSGAVSFGVAIVIVDGGACLVLVFIIFKKKRTKLEGTHPSFVIVRSRIF